MSRSVFVALAVSALSATGFAADVTELIAAGDQAMIAFNLPKATLAYQRAFKLDGKSYDASWRLARVLADTSTLESDDAKKKSLLIEAQDYARGAVRLNPTDANGHTALSIVVGKLALYEGGRTKVELSKEVKIEADKAIALDPKEHIAYHVLGVWNREMAQLNWFLRKFAETLYGSFPPASMENALQDLRRATELAPTIVSHQVELGLTLAAAGQWTEAKQTLDHALAMPKTWVTDDYYKKVAEEKLKDVNRHVH